jgi:formimidoylglutamate deiminase
MPILIPDLLYQADAFVPGRALQYDDGRITRIAPADELDGPDAIRLRGRALMPGFVNAHSHAFQRVIRGRTQSRPAAGDVADFWTWRVAMYRAALALEPADVHAVSRFCFIEMLRAGITTVGEFHYLHNDPRGAPYADRAELAHAVIRAARDAGIRIRLLNVCYATGGIDRPLEAGQRRFATPDLDEFVSTTAALADGAAGDPLVGIGVAAHSIRAVPRAWLRPLHDWAAGRDLPFHMHVSEQVAEVDACRGAFGLRPVELLHGAGVLDGRFTAVHATHIGDDEVALLAGAGATVCACPTTERDLGDGFLRARDLVHAGAHIALGTDSQTVIDMLEEMRLIEYHERLLRRERVVVTAPGGAAAALAPAAVLIRMATTAGARSLHLPVGVLEQGARADLIAIDLEHHTLAGWTADTLAALIALSAPADVVADVWVGGRSVVRGRVHDAQADAASAFTALSRRLAEGS